MTHLLYGVDDAPSCSFTGFTGSSPLSFFCQFPDTELMVV